VIPPTDPSTWKSFLDNYPDAHILQTAAWGTLKSQFGWSADYIRGDGGGCQILFRSFTLGVKLAYVPKGPVGSKLSALLPSLLAVSRSQHAFALKIEPDAWEQDPIETALADQGFLRSPQLVQPRRTILVDLQGPEEDILSRMKQKTRYNIRLAARKGVVVQSSQDLAGFADMMRITADRDSFGAHSARYYQTAYDLFHHNGSCELLIASYEGQPLAALMVFRRGARAWYMYGASNDAHRNLMPTYLLQWEAMRWAKRNGCNEYDLWGVPDEDEATLEAEFSTRHDGLWGVYRFKRGFGGKLVRSSGAWDFPIQPALYRLYRTALRIRER